MKNQSAKGHWGKKSPLRVTSCRRGLQSHGVLVGKLWLHWISLSPEEMVPETEYHGGEPDCLEGSQHWLAMLLSLPWRSRWAEDTTPKHLYHTRTSAVDVSPAMFSKFQIEAPDLTIVNSNSPKSLDTTTNHVCTKEINCQVVKSPVQLGGQHELPSHIGDRAGESCSLENMATDPLPASSPMCFPWHCQDRAENINDTILSYKLMVKERWTRQPASQRGSEPNDVTSSPVESNGNSSSLLLWTLLGQFAEQENPKF